MEVFSVLPSTRSCCFRFVFLAFCCCFLKKIVAFLFLSCLLPSTPLPNPSSLSFAVPCCIWLIARGVGDGAADGGFPWRGECLPPADRPLPEEEQETANGGGGSRRSTSSRRPNTRGKGEALRLTRRWSLSSWSVYLQNAPLLRYEELLVVVFYPFFFFSCFTHRGSVYWFLL